VRGGGDCGVGDAGERDGECAERACVGEGSEDVWGAAAGGDTDEGVLCGDACGGEVGCALLGRVFGLLAGFAEGGVAASDYGMEEIGGDGEGWRALAGVEHAETAAG